MSQKSKQILSKVQQIKLQKLQLEVEALWEQLQKDNTDLVTSSMPNGELLINPMYKN